jgi:hypothetical protein
MKLQRYDKKRSYSVNVSGDENYDRGREKDKHTKIKEETTAEKEKKEKR